MSKHRDTKTIEDQLADFTDRLLDGKDAPVESAPYPASELDQLQETARHLRQVFPPQKPDLAMQNRIRANLVSEWRRNGLEVQKASRISRKLHLSWGFGLAVCVVAILAVFLTFVPSGVLGTPGTAGNNTAGWIPLVVFLVVVAGLIFWQMRKK